jgi:hypothetical protein
MQYEYVLSQKAAIGSAERRNRLEELEQLE